jgi:lipid-A-disaccharide synthase
MVAGEASGDLIGARLMAALKRRTGGAVRFAGVGGELMMAEGIESLFPISELSVMGLLEVAPHVPRLLRRIRETAAVARRLRPNAVVTIDSPEFNFRVAQRLVGAGMPLIHYVAPTVWAYRPKRAEAIAKFLDHLLLLFPFEPPFFEAVDLPHTFVGHPLVEEEIEAADGQAFRARHNILPDTAVVAVLPGSRHSELVRHLPVFERTLAALGARRAGLHLLMPVVSPLVTELKSAVADWGLPLTVVEGKAEKYAAFAASDAALAASGTVTLELAFAGVPMVVAYRANWLTAALARRLLRVPHVAMVNIVLGRGVVPEFLQENCRADRLMPALEHLLADRRARHAQIDAYKESAARLGSGGQPPSERAADTVLALMKD